MTDNTHRPENWDAALSLLSGGNPALVWRRVIADTETPVGAAVKLFAGERGDFLLESVEGGEVRGRYSLLGLAPDLVFRATGHAAEINRTWATDREAFEPLADDALNELRALVESCRMDVPAALPPALACIVGYFGYETFGLVEKLPRAPQSALELPDMLFVRPTVILVFDRLGDELFGRPGVALGPRARCRAGSGAGSDRRSAARSGRARARTGARRAGHAHATTDPGDGAGRYGNMVEAAKQFIEAGDIFQVVLAQRFTAPFTLPPLRSIARCGG
jgi:anthranilate synthase component 1